MDKPLFSTNKSHSNKHMTSIWLSILTLAKHCKIVRRQGTNIYVCFCLFSWHLVDGMGHGTAAAGKSCGAKWLEQVPLKERQGPAACPIQLPTEAWSSLTLP